MNGTDRVLRALRQRGARGITRVDFQAPDVIDGAGPILNIPARIKELRDAGYAIDNDGRRDKCSVYVLKTSAGPTSLGGPSLIAEVGPVETPGLFDPAETHKPLSPYDQEAA